MTEKSLAQAVAELPDAEREQVLAGLELDDLQYDPQFWLRPTQLRPINETDWQLAAMVAGRGAGKTRSMCEWSRKKAQGRPTRGALVARTAADVRDVLVAGESGILAVSPPSERPDYEPSKRLLTWPNGTTALCFSSEAPDQLRGPQFDWSVADEIASWKYLPDESGLTAWDNLRLATRLGESPQIFAGTTPKRTPFMRSLLKAAETESGVLLLRGSTKDNRGNLSQTYIDMIYGLYEGTALAQQELEGIMLDDIDGALWDERLIEEFRVLGIPKMKRPLVAVGVDPSVSEKPGDETGIVVAVVDAAIRDMYKRHAYILSDASLQAAPEMWAKVLVGEVRRFHGAPVIAETNQGGGLIKAVLTGIDPDIRVFGVHSRYGKAIRAEPVVLAAQQGRVHHVGYFPELEDQLCLAAGTLIETARGHVPIEDIQRGDWVWTRAGYAPVAWAGQTGEAVEMVSVIHEDGCVVSTACHPLWNPSTAQFAPAATVQPGDHLDVRPSPANMVRPWLGMAGGGTAWQKVTTATPGVSFCTAPSGKRTTGRYLMDSSFTTSTTAQATTESEISRWSPTPNTLPSTLNAPMSFVGSRVKSVLHSTSRTGADENREMWSAGSADGPISPLACVPLSAPTRSAVVQKRTVLPESSMPVPVYNLMVAEGYLPEFYANGVLTHNCSWVPDESRKSPDRLDAYVHVLTALLVKQPDGMHSGSVRARSAAGLVLPPAPKPRFRSGALSTVSRRTGGGRVL